MPALFIQVQSPFSRRTYQTSPYAALIRCAGPAKSAPEHEQSKPARTCVSTWVVEAPASLTSFLPMHGLADVLPWQPGVPSQLGPAASMLHLQSCPCQGPLLLSHLANIGLELQVTNVGKMWSRAPFTQTRWRTVEPACYYFPAVPQWTTTVSIATSCTSLLYAHLVHAVAGGWRRQDAAEVL